MRTVKAFKLKSNTIYNTQSNQWCVCVCVCRGQVGSRARAVAANTHARTQARTPAELRARIGRFLVRRYGTGRITCARQPLHDRRRPPPPTAAGAAATDTYLATAIDCCGPARACAFWPMIYDSRSLARARARARAHTVKICCDAAAHATQRQCLSYDVD